MVIEFKNYEEFNKFIKINDEVQKEKINSSNIKLRKKIKSMPSFQEEINNNYEFLFPKMDKVIPVIFYDFSVWCMVKNLHKSVFKRIETKYDPKDEKIYIKKGEFSKDYSFCSKFFEYSHNKINLRDIGNIIILHEIGHAIHHQSSKISKKYIDDKSNEAKFINELMSFNECLVSHHKNSGKIIEVELIARQATREGYADLYCCIILDKIYGKNKAEPLIKALYEFRNNAHILDGERYYSFDSIEAYMLSRNNLNFKNFNEIHEYISEIISKNAIKCINNSYNYSYSNFIGAINSIFDINEKEVNKSLDRIEKRFPFLYIKKKGIVNWRFEDGCKDGKNWQENKNLSITKRKIKSIKTTLNKNIEKILIKSSLKNN